MSEESLLAAEATYYVEVENLRRAVGASDNLDLTENQLFEIALNLPNNFSLILAMSRVVKAKGTWIKLHLNDSNNSRL